MSINSLYYMFKAHDERKRKEVTINLSAENNYSNSIKFKRWEILKVSNFPFSSRKRYNIITNDTETNEEGSATISMYGLNISRWWLIRKIQLKVLRTVFKAENPYQAMTNQQNAIQV